jgi:DcmR-like sensory protein
MEAVPASGAGDILTDMNSQPDTAATHHHAVQFYGTDESLFTTVATFLAEGLVSGQPAVVIATPTHRVSIVNHLRARLIDCDRALRLGDLVLLDAEATLDLFMVHDMPEAGLFESNVGRLLEQAINGRRTVLRAYGEMVDVLWKQGRSEAAIRLEILWNQLVMKYNFALLCGYSMGSFYKQTQQLEEVIALHTNVVAHDTNVVQFPPKRPLTA